MSTAYMTTIYRYFNEAPYPQKRRAPICKVLIYQQLQLTQTSITTSSFDFQTVNIEQTPKNHAICQCHLWTFASLQPFQDHLIPHLFITCHLQTFIHKQLYLTDLSSG